MTVLGYSPTKGRGLLTNLLDPTLIIRHGAYVPVSTLKFTTIVAIHHEMRNITYSTHTGSTTNLDVHDRLGVVSRLTGVDFSPGGRRGET